ncbi:helix-turn-helix domain-containing protein [Dyadobacter sandarakinus]|nr:helix-turn-helix transcriptional regulator [Dyadobacter sandarakinus]
MIDFGSNFRKLREWTGLSQETLANILSVSASVINRIENNKRRLDIQIIYNMSARLDLDITVVMLVLIHGKDALPGRNPSGVKKASLVL